MNKQNLQKKRKGKETYGNFIILQKKLSQRKFRLNRPVKNKLGMLLTTQEEQLKR